MFTAILFDLFNTLAPGGSADDREVVNTKMGALLGVDPEAFHRVFARSAPERFLGLLGSLTDAVDTLARRLGGSPTPEQVAHAAALRIDLSAGLLDAVSARTLDALARLRAAGWRLGLVSNTTAEAPAQWRRSALPPYFDTAVFSNEIGAAKPDPAIFLAACQAMRVPPTQCYYVGDGADLELAAASSLGMRAIRTTEHQDTDPSWPGPTVSAIAELPGLLVAT